MASVKAFVVEMTNRHMQESMRKAARGNKGLKFTGKPIQKGEHPFITEFKL
ncbi:MULTISPECIES: hypothetical protein [Salipiger]|uniref:hypothetical protein n=1 Tax=Salipiger TaxID=263377 RepID=UPI003513AF30